ncbi:hypothetical protein ACFL6C_04210 [Myxococcota bacterium]
MSRTTLDEVSERTRLRAQLQTTIRIELGFLEQVDRPFKPVVVLTGKGDVRKLLQMLPWKPMPAIGAKIRWHLRFVLPDDRVVDAFVYSGGWHVTKFHGNSYGPYDDTDDKLYRYVETVFDSHRKEGQ